MNFNSIEYAIFLPIVFVLYWAIPHKYRWVLLLISSYYFYMSWNPKYVVLIAGTTLISYFAALMLEKSEEQKTRKFIVIGTLVVCLGVLFIFKYFNFISTSIADCFSFFTIKLNPVTVKFLLPVGISFYTFQTLSYVIDVYKGNVCAERHLGIYATFISFFPQLVAGPIERTSNLLPQIKSEKQFDYNLAVYGMKQMAWGFYKKLVIADVVSAYVDLAYSNIFEYKGIDLLLAMLFFTLQIYCDFSGYSDIAIGTAKLLGINLMTNFKSPYYSTSIKEFWSRWHISLSTWFRDYVYIPLGGNRCSTIRNYYNLFITFLVSGLWHGANWTYIIWGAFHGIGQIIEKIFDRQLSGLHKSKLGRVLSIFLVFIFCNILWVFFRAESFSAAIYVISNVFSGITNPTTYCISKLGISKLRFATIFFNVIILSGFDYINMKLDIFEEVAKKPAIVRAFAYAILLMLIMCFRSAGEADFVYFQF